MALFTLKLRRQVWYLRYYVPKEQREAVGFTERTVTLQTSDKRIAIERAPARCAMLQIEIAQMARLPLPAANPASILEYARSLGRDVLAGRLKAGDMMERDDDTGELILTPDPVEEALDRKIEEHLETHRDVDKWTGYPKKLHPDFASSVAAARLAVVDPFFGAVAAPTFKTLGEWIESYLTLKAQKLAAASIEAKRRELGRFAAWAGMSRNPQEITRAVATAYIDEKVETRKCAPKTKIDEASNLCAFFNWLQDRADLSFNPFAKAKSKIQVDARGAEKSRRAWNETELTTILSSPFPSSAMAAASLIALYSGARLEEICARKVGDVDRDSLIIRAGKNQSSVRRVPIHATLQPLIARLVDTSTDGFLIGGLSLGKTARERKRSHQLSKRFGKHCDRLGLTDSRINFHTFRNTVITVLHRAQVLQTNVSIVVGHAMGGITFNLYSDGPAAAQLRDTVNLISHGPKVDALAVIAIAAHPGNTSTKSRGTKRAA